MMPDGRTKKGFQVESQGQGHWESSYCIYVCNVQNGLIRKVFRHSCFNYILYVHTCVNDIQPVVSERLSTCELSDQRTTDQRWTGARRPDQRRSTAL